MEIIQRHPLPITPDILSLIAAIDEFKGAWNARHPLPPERLERLSRVALTQAVVASHRLEGMALTTQSVNQVLSRLSLRTFSNREEQAAAGYAETMTLIRAKWATLSITGYHLKELHRALHAYSDKDNWHRGKYKISTTQTITSEPEGQAYGIEFENASAFEAPRLMTQLFSWLASERERKHLHPLLLIAIFIITFHDINPFQQGNGRLSRLLTTLLLLQAGYQYVTLVPLESIFERDPQHYYQARKATQQSLRRGSPDWHPWITYFLTTLASIAPALTAKLDREKRVSAQLPRHSLAMLEHVEAHGRLTMAGAITLTAASRNTLKQQLRHLVESGALLRHGQGRSVWYSLP
jgi:Fic family protein